MRRVINATYVTIDGVIQDPQDWPALGSSSGAGDRIQTKLLQSCDAAFLGRRTYESFASVWSGRSGDAYTDRINAIPKYVASTTLTDPPWESTIVLDRDPIGAVRELKEQPGGDIVQYGFGPLAHSLMATGLLDEVRLWVHPFFVGTGTADDTLYRAGSAGRWDLADIARLDNGIVILTYRM